MGEGRSRDSDRRRDPTAFIGSLRGPASRDDHSAILEVDRREPHLLVYGGIGKGAEFPLRGERTLIGRDPGADVRLDGPSVSRRHAVIERRRGRYFLRDLGSANGTHLDGPLVGSERPLHDGARFRIGETEILFRDPPAEAD